MLKIRKVNAIYKSAKFHNWLDKTKEITLHSFNDTKKKTKKKTKGEINGYYVFFSHKTHHFIHGVIKMNTFDDFVLDQNNTLLC